MTFFCCVTLVCPDESDAVGGKRRRQLEPTLDAKAELVAVQAAADAVNQDPAGSQGQRRARPGCGRGFRYFRTPRKFLRALNVEDELEVEKVLD